MNGLTINLALDHPDLMPKQMTDGAAGWDLRSAYDHFIQPNEACMLSTGVKLAIPEGYVGLLHVRSSVAKNGIILLNGVGVIDSDYRGEIKGLLYNVGEIPLNVNKGDRILQLLISPVPKAILSVVNDLSPTNRGDKGFGSTGRNDRNN